jgi:peptide-methionine (R)-S-oxide reductase
MTDLYMKETDKVQYLLPTLCHPSHIFKNVPYSLALRLVRICSEKADLERRLSELKDMLKSRKYNTNIINAAITKAKNLERKEVLKKVEKHKNERVVLALTYHPKLPSISSIIKKHYRTMIKDQTTKKIFPLPPMLAYKQPPNLRNKLCHAKLPKQNKQKRPMTGTKPCNKPCGI